MRYVTLYGLLLSVLVAAPAFAQSATGAGSVMILRPLTVTKNADLRFGSVVRPAATGTVIISTLGVRTFTGGIVGLSSGTAPGASQFTLSGEGGQSVSVTVPATFTVANSTDTLTVTTSNDMTGTAATQTLSAASGSAGALVVNVGGTMTILSTTPTGAYTGTLTVSAAYN